MSFERWWSDYGFRIAKREVAEEIWNAAQVAAPRAEVGTPLVLATEKGLTPIGECVAALQEMITALQEVDDYDAQNKAETRARAAIAALGTISPPRLTEEQ